MTTLALILALLTGRLELAKAGIYGFVGDAYDTGEIACPKSSPAQVRMGFAHRTAPCGTKAIVCARRCVEAWACDRGPYFALTKHGGRLRKRLRIGETYRGDIDLRPDLAQAIGYKGGAVWIVWEGERP